MSEKTIILLDDDDSLRNYFSAALEDVGYKVIQKANSFGIVELISNTTPVLVIMDMVMPDHEGIEGVLNIVDRFTVPIIAISAHAEYLFLVEHLVSSTLLKPLDSQTLLQEVEKVFGLP